MKRHKPRRRAGYVLLFCLLFCVAVALFVVMQFVEGLASSRLSLHYTGQVSPFLSSHSSSPPSYSSTSALDMPTISLPQWLLDTARAELKRVTPTDYQLQNVNASSEVLVENFGATKQLLLRFTVRGNLLGDPSILTEVPLSLLLLPLSSTSTSTEELQQLTQPRPFLFINPPLSAVAFPPLPPSSTLNHQQPPSDQQPHFQQRHYNPHIDQKSPASFISIVYVTKRPGSFDLLLHSLAQQTDSRYELIVVDELAYHRRDAVKLLAESLRVHLVQHVPGKPKTRPHKYGICNGINTGLIYAKGYAVAVVMDMAWLPSHFVARIHQFYREHSIENILAFPEAKMDPPAGLLDRERLTDDSAVSIFAQNVEHEPMASGWRTSLGPFPPHLKNELVYEPEKEYYELYCAAFPRLLIENLNGLDEELDRGHDRHQAWLKDRAVKLGYGVYLDHGTIIQTVDHYSFEHDQKLDVKLINGVPHIGVATAKATGGEGNLWWRGTKWSNWERYKFSYRKFLAGLVPLRAQHEFQLDDFQQKNVLGTVLAGVLPRREEKFPMTLQRAEERKKKAFATVILAEADIVGAIALAASLGKRSDISMGDIELVVLVACKLSEKEKTALGMMFSFVLEVTPLANPMLEPSLLSRLPFGSQEEKSLWENSTKPLLAADKSHTILKLWSLTQYSKIVYLSATTTVLQNIDELFLLPELSAVGDFNPPDNFNIGLMVLEPSLERYSDLLNQLRSVPCYQPNAQEFLNHYFASWFSCPECRLRTVYNTQAETKVIFFPGYYKNEKYIRVLQFPPDDAPWTDTPPCSKRLYREQAKWWLDLQRGIRPDLDHGSIWSVLNSRLAGKGCYLGTQRQERSSPGGISRSRAEAP